MRAVPKLTRLASGRGRVDSKSLDALMAKKKRICANADMIPGLTAQFPQLARVLVSEPLEAWTASSRMRPRMPCTSPKAPSAV